MLENYFSYFHNLSKILWYRILELLRQRGIFIVFHFIPTSLGWQMNVVYPWKTTVKKLTLKTNEAAPYSNGIK